jgi:serine/threonine-protein kinase
MDTSEDNTREVSILTSGTTVGHYRIVQRLGAGGMGDVYLADDTSLGRQVALKFLATHLSEHDHCRQRFVREAQAAAKLDHPNIVTVHDVGENDGRPYFAMARVDGRTLKDLISQSRFEIEDAIGIALQVAEGLRAAHEAGITHRDIKPSNILVDSHGRARIVDFGLASVRGTEHLTRTGSTLGTIGYMSPEQVRGDEVDGRSDLFSLGVVLYELLAGEPPFRADNEAATLYAIVNTDPTPLSEIRPDIPQSLQDVVNKALEKTPDQRYRTATDIIEDLSELRQDAVSSREETAGDNSIAVLPFTNLSADPEQEYFCDGIAEDIINDLTHIPGLRVVARTSAFAFKGRADDIRQIGKRLNVGCVLEGSVRKGGDRIRVSAQLINVASGYHVWSEKYDRDLKDIFVIQDDISHAIAEKLKVGLGSTDGIKTRAAGDTSFEAYQLYSQGRHQLNFRTGESITRALDFFKQSARLAPDYPLARVGLADAYFLLFAYDLMDPRKAIAHARVYAQRAINLDVNLADPHATLGGIHTYYDWSWSDAEAEFQRALELSPGHSTAHQWLGELLSFLGRHEEAEYHFGMSLRSDPLCEIVITMTGCHHLRMNRPQKALEYLLRAEELGSQNDTVFVMAGFAYLALGDQQSAVKQFDEACLRSHDSTYAVAMTGHARALMGDRAAAEKALRQLETLGRSTYVSRSYLAALQHDLGDEKAALSYLRDSIRRRDSESVFLAIMPYYSSLRSDPALAALLSLLELPSDEIL